MAESNGGTPQPSAGVALKFEPKFMDSLDARILQYKYALVKLERLISAIDGLLEEVAGSKNCLVLVHYIIYLASNVFAINEPGFGSKLDALENYKIPKAATVPTSQIVTHIPYDMRDQAIVPLHDLPAISASLSCLKAFRALCVTCQEGYQKRFMNASREIKNDAYMEDLDVLFTKSFFDLEKDFDTTLTSTLFARSSFLFQIDSEMSSLGDYAEASLIDIDICALFTIVSETSRTLGTHKALINKYKTIKQAPKSAQESQFKGTPHSAYALHRVFFWALRINEVYFNLRRFGRQIFIANHDHLNDQKFMSFVTNGIHYRDMLKEIDENFFNAKKNGVLIATITRFLRMDSKHEAGVKSVSDFIGFIAQSVVHIDGLLSVLKDFGHAWIATEIAFRLSHSLPIDYLHKINDTVEGEKVKELRVKRLRAQLLAKQKAKQNTPAVPAKAPVKRQAPPTVVAPKPTAAQSTPVKTASTAGPERRVEETPESTPEKKPLRREAEKKANPGPASQNPISSPSPFYLQRQSSLTSLSSASSASSLTEKPSAPFSIPAGRRRSSSQPISYNAAAAALKGNGLSTPVKQPSTLENTLRSPSGSIKRTGSLTKKSQSPSVSSPLGAKRPVMDRVEERKESSPPPKVEVRRTASQKFKQHLMEASRSGALYSKEKETLTNVVFDPNNPSATNIRRHPKPSSQESSPTKEDPEPLKLNNGPGDVPAPSPQAVQEISGEAKVEQRPTRAQITKRNTRRNSVAISIDNASRLSDLSRISSSISSQSSVSDGTIIKKVRFTGVPEYTPEEDKPTSQSSRILKGFAALNFTNVKNTNVKRKDEAFKQEESKLFRQYINEPQPPAAPSGASGIFAPNSQISSKLSRFKSRF